MHRELDPNLFGAAPARSTTSGASYGLQAPSAAPTTQPGKPIPYPAVDIKVLEAQMLQLKANQHQFERKVEQLGTRFNEIASDSQSRLDRYGEQLLRLEAGIKRLTEDTGDRLALLAGRVNERKVTDTKVQELVDRHNILVRNFENRLTSLQRLASDQEQALLSAHAALEDARTELARLKRL